MSSHSPTNTLSRAEFVRLRDIFDRVCVLPASERGTLLDLECPAGTSLRREIEDLLVADDTVGDRFQLASGENLNDLFAVRTSTDLNPGVQVGPFCIQRVLGRGAMGTVYLARQEDPGRLVALKILEGGAAISGVRSRFEREVRVLGRLEHPGIARIYQAGAAATPVGSIGYYAMEYVDGPRLTEFAQQHRLDTPARVELVAKIADAVQYAHTRGVIHRDLKPANILVQGESAPTGGGGRAAASDQTGDLRAQPKILDFGVARLTEPDTQHTALTERGLVIGTIAYMSPEQLAGDNDAVDARTDVYAMGVLLYQLLTRRMPHDVGNKAVPEAARVVRDEEIAPLNSPLNQDAKCFDRDLITIVGKATAKDRDRRYTTAAALAYDLRRYLRSEPILARPATVTYQLSRFVRRNPALSAVIVALAAVLVASTGVTLIFALGQARALKEATTANRDAQQTSAFLESMLSSVAPGVALGQDTAMLRGILDRTAARARTELTDQPAVLARLLTISGRTYRELGEFVGAQRDLEEAFQWRRTNLGDDHADTLTTAHETAQLYENQSRLPEALALARDTARRQLVLLGSDAPATLESEWLVGAVLTRMESPEAVQTLKRCADSMQSVLGRNDERTINLLTTLAVAHEGEGQVEESLRIKRDLLARCRESFGEEHPLTMTSYNNLSVTLNKRGEFTEAEELCTRALTLRRKVLGPRHPQTLNSLVNLSMVKVRQGDVPAALPPIDEAITVSRESLEPGHFRIGHALRARGEVYLKLHRFADAERDLAESYEILQRVHGPKGQRTVQVAALMAELHTAWALVEASEAHTQAAALWKLRAQPEIPIP